MPKKGLDAKKIACAKQRVFLGIKHGKGKHARELAESTLAPAYQGLQHHFRICFGMKGNTLCAQFITQFAVVVDLAVVSEGVAATRRAHGLVPCRGKVKNGKARLPQQQAKSFLP